MTSQLMCDAAPPADVRQAKKPAHYLRRPTSGSARGADTPPGAARQNVAVTLDKSGKLWRGEDFDDLSEYIRSFKAGGYPVATVAESRCGECGGHSFRVNIDEEEATQRVCLTCGTVAFIGKKTWTVTLQKGKTYRFICDPHVTFGMKGSFKTF